MAADTLNGLRVAILVTDGVEEVELTEPRKALEDAGADTKIVSPKRDKIQSWDFTDWGKSYAVDIPLNATRPEDFDALLLPGGMINPDTLRTDAKAVKFVKSFLEASKPVASICHGLWMLIEAEGVRGRKVTSWPSLKTDLKNAGAQWVDQDVVVDNGVVTSRGPDDMAAFNREMIRLLAQAKAKSHAA